MQNLPVPVQQLILPSRPSLQTKLFTGTDTCNDEIGSIYAMKYKP